MRIAQNEMLDKYTTIKIGGMAKILYFPLTSDELIETVKNVGDKYIIGGGSNLLINDAVCYDAAICLREFNNFIQNIQDGDYRVGAGVRLQRLINTINQDGYGGLEYLFSVPGLIGGAIYMNAGRGRKYNKSISDYILSVDVLYHGEIVTLYKEQCNFGHRSSIFQEGGYVILSAHMRFPAQDKELSRQLKNRRIQFCKEFQDNTLPNFGSVFSQSSGLIMKIIQRIGFGNKHVHFSKKTENWILKEKNATFTDVINVIQKVEKIHNLFRKKIKREVIIWN